MDDLNTEVNVLVSRATVRPPLRRKLWPRLLWLLFLVLVLAGVGWVVFHPRTAPQVRGGRFSNNGPMPVAAATAEKGDMPVRLNALGTVTPLATVTVRTQINGQLMQVGFKEGDMVSKGDFLAEIDPRPYQATLDQMQGQLQRDQALLKNAQLDLTRYRKLVAENSMAQQLRDTQESLVHQLEGTVKADEAQVESAKLNLTYCRIVAPVTGRAGLRQVDPGNYVQLSDANGIVVITQTKPISVIFTLPEDTLPAIVKRLRAGATLAVTGFNRTQTTTLATGVLTTVDNQVDTSTGTVKLRAQFDNADESLFPNQFVNAQLLVDTLKDVTVVPTAAVQRGAPGTFVYVIKPDDTVAVQPVKLGPTAGERVAVQEGLTPGERVVVDGADKLRDGAKVTVPGANAGAGDGAAGAQQPAAGQGQQGGRPSRSSP